MSIDVLFVENKKLCACTIHVCYTAYFNSQGKYLIWAAAGYQSTLIELATKCLKPACMKHREYINLLTQIKVCETFCLITIKKKLLRFS